MKPRPLHRSLTFWLGVPGLIFILWCWRDSMAHDTGIFREVVIGTRIQGTDGIMQTGSLLIIQHHRSTGSPRPAFFHTPIRTERNPNRAPQHLQKTFPMWNKIITVDPMGTGGGITRTVIILPHWLILTAYATAWGSLIYWRSRRHRLAKTDTSAAAQPPAGG